MSVRILFLSAMAVGLAFSQTSGYWKLVDTRTYKDPYGAGHNTTEDVVLGADGGTFSQWTMGYGPKQGATMDVRFAIPPGMLLAGKPFPVAGTVNVTWSAYSVASVGFAKVLEADFDTVNGEEDVWPLPGVYAQVFRIEAGVNYSLAKMAATADNASAASPMMVPAVAAAKTRRTLRYLATNGGNFGWGWVYEWTTGTPGTCGGTCAVAAPAQVIGAAGGTGNVAVTASSTWDVIPIDSWIQLTSPASKSGSGNGSVIFTIPANTGAPRSGTILIGGQTYTIYQDGTPSGTTAGCGYLIQSSTTQSVPVTGTTSGLIQIVTNQTCAWTATKAADWITIKSGSSGTGNGAVSYTVAVNDTGNPRSAAIVIDGQNVAINQAGGVPPGTPAVSAGGIVNAASYAPGGPPAGSLAQGSFFSIYGTSVGPESQIKASSYPLLVTLGGVGVQITSGSQKYDAYLVFVSSGQINAVLPSKVPVGSAQVLVTYNGKTSAAANITVAPTSLGLFYQQVNGKNMAIAQNVNGPTDYPLNLPDVPAKPGQIVILWGTGLGPINAADNVAPPAGDMTNVPVTITVGGVNAQRVYAGRQPESAAVDNVYFTVPDGVPFGCQVPVAVTAGGVAANTTMIAITADGSPCQ